MSAIFGALVRANPHVKFARRNKLVNFTTIQFGTYNICNLIPIRRSNHEICTDLDGLYTDAEWYHIDWKTGTSTRTDSLRHTWGLLP